MRESDGESWWGVDRCSDLVCARVCACVYMSAFVREYVLGEYIHMQVYL